MSENQEKNHSFNNQQNSQQKWTNNRNGFQYRQRSNNNFQKFKNYRNDNNRNWNTRSPQNQARSRSYSNNSNNRNRFQRFSDYKSDNGQEYNETSEQSNLNDMNSGYQSSSPAIDNKSSKLHNSLAGSGSSKLHNSLAGSGEALSDTKNAEKLNSFETLLSKIKKEKDENDKPIVKEKQTKILNKADDKKITPMKRTKSSSSDSTSSSSSEDSDSDKNSLNKNKTQLKTNTTLNKVKVEKIKAETSKLPATNNNSLKNDLSHKNINDTKKPVVSSSSSSSSSSDSESSSDEEPSVCQSTEDVIFLGKLEQFENLANDDDKCLLCDEIGHTSFQCQMICKNCGESYHNLKNCKKPPNVSIVLQYFFEFCMKQCVQYNPNESFDLFNKLQVSNDSLSANTSKKRSLKRSSNDRQLENKTHKKQKLSHSKVKTQNTLSPFMPFVPVPENFFNVTSPAVTKKIKDSKSKIQSESSSYDSNEDDDDNETDDEENKLKKSKSKRNSGKHVKNKTSSTNKDNTTSTNMFSNAFMNPFNFNMPFNQMLMFKQIMDNFSTNPK